MTDDQLPQPGEVWNASASVQHAALVAAKGHSAARPSQLMQQDLLTYTNSSARARKRPCIVFSTAESTTRIFLITKLEGVPRDSVNGHINHFLIPFGDDEVGNQLVIKATPPWPTSYITPTYVFGYPVDVPTTAMSHIHHINGKAFEVEPDELDKLQRVAEVKLASYVAIPLLTMQRYNASWAEDKLRRLDLDGLAGPASAPAEPLSVARPVGTMLIRGVNIVNLSHFQHLQTIQESRTDAAQLPPSAPSLELGIDQEDWPALHPAVPKAATEPGPQRGSAWTQPLMRSREEETAGFAAWSQTVTMPPEAVHSEEAVAQATEEAPWIPVTPRRKNKRQSSGTGDAT